MKTEIQLEYQDFLEYAKAFHDQMRDNLLFIAGATSEQAVDDDTSKLWLEAYFETADYAYSYKSERVKNKEEVKEKLSPKLKGFLEIGSLEFDIQFCVAIRRSK